MRHFLAEKLDKFFVFMANNKPIRAVAVIATAKAIMRPSYSLANKEEPKETRYYAALRDFMTELVAIPSYIGMSKLAEKGSKWLTEFSEKASEEVKKQKVSGVKDVLQFIAICGTATFIIPYLCNLTLPYAMKALKNYQKKNEGQDVKKLDVISESASLEKNNNSIESKTALNTPVSQKYNMWKKSMTSFSDSNMRIGS